uniref:Uncharacterized protein n=1 Tax=Anopheles minimus TaxID=112268 RepID=A0A182VSP2_9DIPT
RDTAKAGTGTARALVDTAPIDTCCAAARTAVPDSRSLTWTSRAAAVTLYDTEPTFTVYQTEARKRQEHVSRYLPVLLHLTLAAELRCLAVV